MITVLLFITLPVPNNYISFYLSLLYFVLLYYNPVSPLGPPSSNHKFPHQQPMNLIQMYDEVSRRPAGRERVAVCPPVQPPLPPLPPNVIGPTPRARITSTVDQSHLVCGQLGGIIGGTEGLADGHSVPQGGDFSRAECHFLGTGTGSPLLLQHRKCI